MSTESIITTSNYEQKNSKAYGISLYGRFGYSVTFLAGIPFCGFLFLPFSTSAPNTSIIGSLLCYMLGIGSWFLLIYSCTQLFRRKPRFVLDDNGFSFRGLFYSRYFKWSDVERLNIGIKSRLGFVFLIMRLSSASRWKKVRKFDVSGLSPNYKELITEMNSHLAMVSKNRGLKSHFCPVTLRGEYLIRTKENINAST